MSARRNVSVRVLMDRLWRDAAARAAFEADSGIPAAEHCTAEYHKLFRMWARWRVTHETLKQVVEACAYVSPLAGAVATESSVKHIRQAGHFIEALEKARALLAETPHE